MATSHCRDEALTMTDDAMQTQCKANADSHTEPSHASRQWEGNP